MALTTEQQAQLDLQTAIANMQSAIEQDRITLHNIESAKSRKLDMVRLAREILQENRRLATVGSVSDITADDVISLADALSSYVNA